jgi:hypothetical protein
MGIDTGGMNPTGVGSYNGYPGSKYWNVDSRPLSEATNVLRSFVLQNIVQDNQWEIDRITKYYLYWKFYDGMHYKDFNDGMLSFNYIKAFIDKVNMFLLGDEAFTFHVQSYYTTQIDKEIEKLAEELMMYHWGKSDKLQLAYEILQMGGITGDAWLGLTWMPEEGDKYCKVSVFDSRQCFVTFKDGDYSNVESFLVRQPLDNHGDNKYKLYVQRWTKEKVETWYQLDVSIEESKVAKYEHKQYKNKYGFIPVVHIKNKPNSAGYYGKSDANDILKINKIYNEIMQQLKAVIDYHVTPTTVITGASAKSLKKGLGQIWSGLPAEANVFNLGLDVDLSATVNFAKDLKTAMHELSDVPENALGKIQAISNTSAAALQITYHPLMQQANIKAMTYGEGITKINHLMLRMMMIEDPENPRLVKLMKKSPDFLSEMKIEPIFCYGFPKDKMDELQRAQLELQMKLGSRREIMERMGKQNIPELLDEIDEDSIHEGLLQARIQQMVQDIVMGSGGEKGGEGDVPPVNPEDKTRVPKTPKGSGKVPGAEELDSQEV